MFQPVISTVRKQQAKGEGETCCFYSKRIEENELKRFVPRMNPKTIRIMLERSGTNYHLEDFKTLYPFMYCRFWHFHISKGCAKHDWVGWTVSDCLGRKWNHSPTRFVKNKILHLRTNSKCVNYLYTKTDTSTLCIETNIIFNLYSQNYDSILFFYLWVIVHVIL